jgi:DNA-binding transcriptional ArsR family regulator
MNYHPTQSDLERFADRASAAERVLKLLASEQRLRVLVRLLDGEASVGELSAHAKLAHSATSQHLSKLRAEGLVATRRDAQTIYYRLNHEVAEHLLQTVCFLYGADEGALHAA